ncbi:MAG: ASCH domain-containing protein [Candidatus Nitrosopolaris sp.]
MKCLSLKQPYAEIAATGRKTIETRRWNTNFRGKFLIHSSKTIDKEISTLLNIDCSKLTKGAVIGVACLYDVKKYNNKEDFLADKVAHLSDNFSNTKYGFLLKDAKKLNEPIPLLGRLGFFNVSQKIIIDA